MSPTARASAFWRGILLVSHGHAAIARPLEVAFRSVPAQRPLQRAQRLTVMLDVGTGLKPRREQAARPELCTSALKPLRDTLARANDRDAAPQRLANENDVELAALKDTRDACKRKRLAAVRVPFGSLMVQRDQWDT